tara:strand:- start:51 stop:497 length:447 start_codon:yes stop_codon:yes gene_type:complete
MNNRNDIDRPTLTEPRLYIIVRSDIAELTPGKLGAQTGHAASMFARQVRHSGDTLLNASYKQWEGDRGFGTKIVLSATKDDIDILIDTISLHQPCPAHYGIVVDPSYPFRNYFGEMFTAKEMTCAFVFVTPELADEPLRILRKYPLHK